MQKTLVNVTFYNQPKNYTFDCNGFSPARGERVVVKTAKGIMLAKTTTQCFENDDERTDYMPVLRIATKADLSRYLEIEKKQEHLKDELEALKAEQNWDFKIVSVELSLDEKYMTINFSSENYVEFKDVAKVISSKYNVRVELRQVSGRDEVKVVGGIGVCGKICCCKQYLQECPKVSLKMAKVQGISLSPTKTNGLCGRLLCCLSFENDYYLSVEADMPKVGSMVQTPKGEGKVVFNNFVTKRTQVVFDGEEKKKKVYEEFDVAELVFTKSAKKEVKS